MYHHYNRLKSIQLPIIDLWPHIFMKIGDFRSILDFFGPEIEVYMSQEKSKWMKIVWNVLRHICTTIINRLKSIQIPIIIDLWPHILMKIGNFRSILVYFGPEMEVQRFYKESKWIKIVRNVYRYEHNIIIIDYNQFKYQ